jgi:hypothetical protein
MTVADAAGGPRWGDVSAAAPPRTAMRMSFTRGETRYHSSFACAMLASSALTRDCAKPRSPVSPLRSSSPR